jgi:hypothetical protein
LILISLHSGIFIKYNGVRQFFHFLGDAIRLTPVGDGDLIYFKELRDIQIFIPAILAYFRKIKANSKPKYAYYYTGAIYGPDGKLKDETGFPEYFTCVGFCLAVIKNLTFGTDFINYNDWPLGHRISEDYIHTWFEKHIKPFYPKMTIEKFGEGIRRIVPLEYITAAYSDNRPVRKTFTDHYKPQVKVILKEFLATDYLESYPPSSY